MQYEFDLVIYGATGFTGRLAAQYLAGQSKHPPLRLAIAGRNPQKLEEIAQLCLVKPTIILADSSRPASIDALVARTRAVLSFAGPFSLYGEPLIAACARLGRDYLDITGETPFIRQMIERYQTLADSRGARLIPFSGFDSVPADVCMYLAGVAGKSKGLQLDDYKMYYQIRGGLNGGTLASALTLAATSKGRELYDPNALILDPKWPRGPRANMKPQFEPAIQRWSCPFFMGPVNKAVVRRSAWLRDHNSPSAKPFGYEERMLVGRSLAPVQATLITGVLAGFGFLVSNAPGRSILGRLGPKPGEGPSLEVRKKGFFRGQLVARCGSEVKIIIRMENEGDPGNELTVAMACESARLAAENAFVGEQKGFITPTVAFGEQLVKRLETAGFRFKTEFVET